MKKAIADVRSADMAKENTWHRIIEVEEDLPSLRDSVRGAGSAVLEGFITNSLADVAMMVERNALELQKGKPATCIQTAMRRARVRGHITP